MYGLYSQAALGAVNPGLSIRYRTFTLTYAEVQAMTNGANPRQIVAGQANVIWIPVSATVFMDKSGAGSSAGFNCRWASNPTINIWSANVSALFGNGGGAALTQRYVGTGDISASVNGLATGTDCKGSALMLYQVNAIAGGATGTARIVIGFVKVRV